GSAIEFNLQEALPYPNPKTGRSTSPRTVMECASIPESLFGSFSSEKERFHTRHKTQTAKNERLIKKAKL
ncbi:MAG: hypothetical protein J1E79_02700, partial [Rikenella sp.]|nr:hypothetical protein [Rikenella sp.]